MARRGSFERRLLVALVLISVVPSLLLVGAGTYLLSEVVALHTSTATWARLAESGRPLLELAEGAGDPVLAAAAAQHREELAASLVQSGRWEYLNRRALQLIPVIALLLAGILVWLAVRFARGIARELTRPIREMVGWAGMVAREEPLPPPAPTEAGSTGDFAVLRDAFRAMSTELAASRARALEEERARTWVAMARSVAHELKNSLTPLRLAVAALQRQTSPQSNAFEPVEVLAAEGARLEELARAFAQFGRLPEGPASEIDLCEQLEYLLRTHLPARVAHRLRAPVDLPRVHGHHDALGRAFSNLILNAADAMGDAGGTLTVKVTTVQDVVEIRFLDTGPGIAPEHLERIWEPDFTTKSRGTGLGLALVRQTLQAHGGGVWARNRPEGGAEFRVVVPISHQLSAISYQAEAGTGDGPGIPAAGNAGK